MINLMIIPNFSAYHEIRKFHPKKESVLLKLEMLESMTSFKVRFFFTKKNSIKKDEIKSMLYISSDPHPPTSLLRSPFNPF